MSLTDKRLTLEQVEETQVFLLQTDLHTNEPESFLGVRLAQAGAYGNIVELYRLPHVKHVRNVTVNMLHALQFDTGTVLDSWLAFPPPTLAERAEQLTAAVGVAGAFQAWDENGSIISCLWENHGWGARTSRGYSVNYVDLLGILQHLPGLRIDTVTPIKAAA